MLFPLEFTFEHSESFTPTLAQKRREPRWESRAKPFDVDKNTATEAQRQKAAEYRLTHSPLTYSSFSWKSEFLRCVAS